METHTHALIAPLLLLPFVLTFDLGLLFSSARPFPHQIGGAALRIIVSKCPLLQVLSITGHDKSKGALHDLFVLSNPANLPRLRRLCVTDQPLSNHAADRLDQARPATLVGYGETDGYSMAAGMVMQESGGMFGDDLFGSMFQQVQHQNLMARVASVGVGAASAYSHPDYGDSDEDRRGCGMGYGGFSPDQVNELLSQGGKPWEDDAHDVLAALSGDFY